MEITEKIWMDGEVVDWKDANVHIMTHAIHYGGGVFEGIRVYDTEEGRAIFRLKDHMIRFFHSAKVIFLDIPYTVDELCDSVREMVRINGPKADYIRPLAYYGTGVIGLNPVGLPTRVAIACVHMGAYLGEEQQKLGARIITSSWEKPSNRASAVSAKICGNYINSVMARLEAVHRGADEALMLNSEGNVAEGTGENIFMVKKGKIFTTPLSAGILEGITRNSVMEIASDMGYEVIERDIARAELYIADEVFMTGTAAEVLPIRLIDDQVIGEGKAGPVTSELQGIFSDIVRGRNAQYSHWLDQI
ncbi:MAG: branched-chain amino acid transaminase [Methanomassiliicoccales archaeon]|nr:branched-chain amino acid transaminase [Methanomassiliicoccales archaeon]NYT16289.1 branched-chain amino acid transaminase [Methanomassiliicoccales archaeon]